MLLSDVVSPDSIVARSVNIERDMEDETTLQQYIITEKGIAIIGRFVAAMNGEKVSAWSLTGPYGMGKSAFVNFLLSLCGPASPGSTVQAILYNAEPKLYEQFQQGLKKQKTNNKQGFFRIAATASYEPVNRTLAKGLLHALARPIPQGVHKQQVEKLLRKIEYFVKQDISDTAVLVELIKESGALYDLPIVIMLDEFGKNLEYLGQNTGKGDLFILQSLAESNNIFTWVCLHQAFEEYASTLSKKQIQEWGKIQGRFEDISFVEPRRQMVRFIGQTLTRINGAGAFSNLVEKWAKQFSQELASIPLPDKKIIDRQTIQDCYPLHPLVVFCLPDLCSRFAQNDRTLFSFLCGGDPYALSNFLHVSPVDVGQGDLATFVPASLYDYFLAVTNTISMNRPESRRWFEVNAIIEECRHFSEKEQNVLKVTGLLNLLAKPGGLRASKEIITFACTSPLNSLSLTRKNIHTLLDRLVGKGLLIYRQYADEYRLWEGTDFDIAASLDEHRGLLAGLSLDEVLKKNAFLPPVIAARHSYVTGTLRHFERRWSSVDNVHSNTVSDLLVADGIILQCFGDISTPDTVPAITANGKPVIAAYTACERELKDAVIEVAATENMLAQSPELARDGVARKEARYRAGIAVQHLHNLLEIQYTPGHPALSWFVNGEHRVITSQRELSTIVSGLCDKAYHACPVIRNELINRTKLSSATAKARREVIDGMVTNSRVEKLAMTGTGPEVAIYRTMLLANGLHRKIDDCYQFIAPDKGSTYYPAWQALDAVIEDAKEKELPLTGLVNILLQPPVCMKYGPAPILICLYLLVKSDELALYREGRFLPSLTCEEMELLVKRPELFTVKCFKPTGLRNEIFQVYQKLLNTSPATGEKKIRNADMVSVVGPLVQFASGLSDYIRQTKTISKQAQAARRVLLAAKDPILLLFTDLPKALGTGVFSESQDIDHEQVNRFQHQLRDALLELTRADQLLLEEIRENLLAAFESSITTLDKNADRLQKELYDRAVPMVSRCADKKLRPFLKTLTRSAATIDDWLVAVATIVTQRPVDCWHDTDLQIFTARIHDFARRFFALEIIISAELSLPGKSNGRDVRFISMMTGDGSMPGKVISVENSSLAAMRDTMSELDETYSRQKLEALMILLGEKLLITDVS